MSYIINKKMRHNPYNHASFLLFYSLFPSSKLNDIDNQTLYYTMVQIW